MAGPVRNAPSIVRLAPATKSALGSRRQGGKATTVPEVGWGLPWPLTDRKTAGDILPHFLRAGQGLGGVHGKRRVTGESM
jgi:hypothetical protein